MQSLVSIEQQSPRRPCDIYTIRIFNILTISENDIFEICVIDHSG